MERGDGHTEVLVQSGVDTVSYTLDEGLIEFKTGEHTAVLCRDVCSILNVACICSLKATIHIAIWLYTI